MRTITGTSCFTSVTAAINYYRPLYDTRAEAHHAVLEKLWLGEIYASPPHHQPDQKLIMVDNGTRWAIVSDDKSPESCRHQFKTLTASGIRCPTCGERGYH